jgi:uncharacterized protein (TIGR03663 family)
MTDMSEALGIPRRRALRLPRVRLQVGAWHAAFGSVTLVALALRVVDLGNRPLHHDESAHAWFAWLLRTGEGYHYDPVFHGPLQFYSMTLMYLLVGAGDVAARLAPALFGTALVALPFFLRRRIGSVAAFATSCLLCMSPSFLYYSRFAREDIYVAFFDLLLLVLVASFLHRPRKWHPAAAFGVLALAFATKETTYITAFVYGLFFLALAARDIRARGLAQAPLVVAVRRLGIEAWLWGLATFLAVYTTLFTTFFTNPQGLRDGLYGSIDYWLSQQDVNRGDQPWFYYGIVVPAYEWPALLLAAVGVVVAARRLGTLGALLIWLAVSQFAVYSWASERMPWLTLHVLLPIMVLAGIGFGALWDARDRIAGKVALALAVAAVGAGAVAAFGLAYARPADPRELLVFVQSSDEVAPIRDELAALDRRSLRLHGRHLRLQVDGWGGTAWPWAWYLRKLPASYDDLAVGGINRSADAILVADPNHDAHRAELRQFRGRRFKLREWWVPEYGRASASDWVRWLVERRTWTSRASMDEWLYVRKSL